MIDELDAFNAAATLAIARAARVPFKAPPQLASEAKQAASLATEDRAPEDAAFRWVFGRDTRSMFSIYSRFWDLFKFRTGPVSGCRITVNAPSGAVASEAGGSVVDVRYDARLGRALTLPDRWAIPVEEGSAGYVDDIILFSEDGMTEAVLRRLVDLTGPGTSITFVRPSKRCDPWFSHCAIRHDFSTFTALLDMRAEIEPLHESPASDPVLASVYGVSTLRA